MNCKYGSACTRKNSEHIKQFHSAGYKSSGDDTSDEVDSNDDFGIDESLNKKNFENSDIEEDSETESNFFKKQKKKQKLNVCKYHPKCYQKNPAHLKQFDHPTKKKSAIVKKKTSIISVTDVKIDENKNGGSDTDIDDNNIVHKIEVKEEITTSSITTTQIDDNESTSDDDLMEINGIKPKILMVDGQVEQVKSASSDAMHNVKRTGNHYYCTCLGWRTAKGPVYARTCKHLKELLGDGYEQARLTLRNPLAMPSSSSTKGKKRKASDLDSSSTKKDVSLLLANKWDIETGSDPTGWWISEKLDGVRCFFDSKEKCFYSRLGNKFDAPSTFCKGFPDFDLDGELFGGRNNFNETVSIVKTAGSKEWKKIKFYIFDSTSMPNDTFEDRMKLLNEFFEKNSVDTVKVVEQTKCKNRKHVLELLDEVEGNGGEGLMLRKPNSFYVGKRSSTLLKVKNFYDAEAEVIGYENGKGKHAGVTGALKCKMESGKLFKVGSGLTDQERKSPPKIGDIITYRFQELTPDGVPRFPTYIGVRIDATKAKDYIKLMVILEPLADGNNYFADITENVRNINVNDFFTDITASEIEDFDTAEYLNGDFFKTNEINTNIIPSNNVIDDKFEVNASEVALDLNDMTDFNTVISDTTVSDSEFINDYEVNETGLDKRCNDSGGEVNLNNVDEPGVELNKTRHIKNKLDDNFANNPYLININYKRSFNEETVVKENSNCANEVEEVDLNEVNNINSHMKNNSNSVHEIEEVELNEGRNIRNILDQYNLNNSQLIKTVELKKNNFKFKDVAVNHSNQQINGWELKKNVIITSFMESNLIKAPQVHKFGRNVIESVTTTEMAANAISAGQISAMETDRSSILPMEIESSLKCNDPTKRQEPGNSSSKTNVIADVLTCDQLNKDDQENNNNKTAEMEVPVIMGKQKEKFLLNERTNLSNKKMETRKEQLLERVGINSIKVAVDISDETFSEELVTNNTRKENLKVNDDRGLNEKEKENETKTERHSKITGIPPKKRIEIRIFRNKKEAKKQEPLNTTKNIRAPPNAEKNVPLLDEDEKYFNKKIIVNTSVKKLDWKKVLFNHRSKNRIFVVNEIDEEGPPKFNYINDYIWKNVKMPDPCFLEKCDCEFDCVLTSECSCTYTSINCASNVRKECNSECSCTILCENRVTQRSSKIDFTIKRFNKKGWGVLASTKIKKGEYIEQYLGCIMRISDLNSLHSDLQYTFQLDMGGDEEVEYLIDALENGNISRFFNHCCDSNMVVKAIYRDTPFEGNLYRLGFFASKDIEVGEELTFNYSGKSHIERIQNYKKSGSKEKNKKKGNPEFECLCGSQNCYGII